MCARYVLRIEKCTVASTEVVSQLLRSGLIRTDYARVLIYEHIMVQNRNNTDIRYLKL